jgi:signal transduction histidine kinase
MNTLRAKLIALLAGAILLVVTLATWLNWHTLGRPDFSELVKANAIYIGHLVGHVQEQTETAGIAVARLQDAPAGGRLLVHFTADLRAELIRSGLPAEVVVSLPTEKTWPVVSLDLPGQAQKLVFPAILPPRPPSTPPTALIGWIALIAAGTIAISVAAVYRLTQPLLLVERSVANVDAGGELPPLPETGPAEVRVTARAINRLSARLKQAMDSRMRLVAAAGHDLRTPMTRMRLRAEFLGETDRQKWLADLDELDHIADSAISLVREETAVEEQNPIRLDFLLREVVAELGELGMDLRLGSTAVAEIVIRPLSLKRALRNLLVNAATHGKGATITLSNSGAVAMIEILDRGNGIPDHLLERAMEPFFRADPVHSPRGAGLGLAIAREIILRNGGQLTLANTPTGGLAQTITVPIHYSGSAAASYSQCGCDARVDLDAAAADDAKVALRVGKF